MAMTDKQRDSLLDYLRAKDATDKANAAFVEATEAATNAEADMFQASDEFHASILEVNRLFRGDPRGDQGYVDALVEGAGLTPDDALTGAKDAPPPSA